ncbi:hypothetical protein AB0L40_10925 [Patulibacter sp. NPDC049589]|uniref:hypothetical protein n=1 Tax=Patulibacter sp. NPDC049589 TaxID=3154731 RepID=UPI00342B9461
MTIRRARGIGAISVAATYVLLTTTGCGGDDEPKAPAARATISLVAPGQTSVVARRGQDIAVAIATVRVPRGTQVRLTASTPDAQDLRGGRLRTAADQRLGGTALDTCLTKDHVIAPTSHPVCVPEATGPGTWNVAVLAKVSTRADLGVATISRISLASGTQEPAPGASAGSPTYFRDDTRYDLRDTAVSVQVVDELPSIVAPTGRRGSVDVHRDLP